MTEIFIPNYPWHNNYIRRSHPNTIVSMLERKYR